ncbi:MAG: hypothetical protein LBI79_04550 [Nitrososphaerota archaeon]|jgi:formaldehyde-activating enzyme involved in methanogenesis|nr:hypothetical protein [Nitrososphaerota archaeon]
MTPTVQLYCIRIALGLVSGIIAATFAQFAFSYATGFSPLFNCISVALIIYLVTFYILKASYKNKIEQQSKILSTGIGIYFFSWLVALVVVYTIMQIYLV